MAREFIIYADESKDDGPRYGNFYGGALVTSVDLLHVESALQSAKDAVGIHAEVKWQKVSKGYLDRYIAMMDTLFDLAESGRIKLRVMFTDRRIHPTGLDDYHRTHRYHLLYYQFIKHAFGLEVREHRGCARSGPALSRRHAGYQGEERAVQGLPFGAREVTGVRDCVDSGAA